MNDLSTHDDFDDAIAVKSRLPLVVFILVAIGGLGAALWFFVFNVTTEPDKVLVAVSIEHDDETSAFWWDGDEAAVVLAVELGDQLAELGFRPQGSTAVKRALEGASDLDAIRAAAAKQGIGIIITGSARIVRTVPLDGELVDYSIELDLGFVDTESGEAFEAPHMPLSFFEWGRDPSEAFIDAAPRMAAVAAAPLAKALSDYALFEKMLETPEELTYDEAKIANTLEPLFRIGGHYANQMKLREDDEKQEALDHEALESSGLQPHLLGDFLAEEHVVGAGPGEQMLLLTEPHYVDVQQDQGEYTIRRESEQLVLAGRDGAERHLLFEHFNFFSAPAISADGSKAVAVIDNRGRSKWLVAVDVQTGAVTLLLAHARSYFSSPSVSPDGSRVAYWVRASRRAPSSLEVIDTDGQHRRLLVEASVSMSYPQWSADGTTLYLAVGSEGRDSVLSIDVDSGDQAFLLGPSARPISIAEALGVPGEGPDTGSARVGDEDPMASPKAGDGVAGDAPPWDPRFDSRFDSPVVTADGAYLVVEEDDGETRYVGRFEVATGAYERLTEMGVKWMEASPVGPWVAVSMRGYDNPDDPAQGDVEVVLIPVSGGEPTPVTLNAVDDIFGGWSRDGKSVFVSQQSRDPGSRRYTSRVYRYDLAF